MITDSEMLQALREDDNIERLCSNNSEDITGQYSMRSRFESPGQGAVDPRPPYQKPTTPSSGSKLIKMQPVGNLVAANAFLNEEGRWEVDQRVARRYTLSHSTYLAWGRANDM